MNSDGNLSELSSAQLNLTRRIWHEPFHQCHVFKCQAITIKWNHGQHGTSYSKWAFNQHPMRHYYVTLLAWAWDHTMNTVKSIYVEDIDSRDGLFQHRNYFIGLRIVRERHRRRHAARRYDITIQGSSVFKRYRQYDVIHRHKTISSFDGFLLSEHSGWTLPDYPKKPSTLSFSRIDTASYIKLVHSCPCAALLASYITPT